MPNAIRTRIALAALVMLASSIAITAETKAAPSAAPEFLCLKDLKAPLDGLSIACYTEAGCAYVEAQKADPLSDYDQESVPYALGREKIEGIVTSSEPIMKKIREFGYACRKLD
jgi:hypothetical protein